MSNSLQDIRDKYLHDVAYIGEYVQYLEQYFLASIRMIANLNAVTPTFSVNPIISNLCDNNVVIKTEMLGYLQSIEEEMQSLNVKVKAPNEPSWEDPTPAGDMILYLLTEIQKGESDQEKLLKNAQSQIEAMCIIKGDIEGFEDYLFLNDDPSRIRVLVDIATEEFKRRKLRSLNTESSYLGMSAKSLELFDASNQINLYKQNFIQVMAYFDSCIFDLVRFCMGESFFEWLAYFDNVNIKTHDMAACSTFNSFKETQIEAFLKKCYVKDLLNILHSKFSGIFTINGDDVYPVLQEMIGRRNVHIHHNGIADQMYLENFNLFGVSRGDYLEISKGYFDNAITTTTQVVTSIAAICS